MENHQLLVRKTARYFTLGNPHTASKLWFVLHGYGQLATFFIRKFNDLDLTQNFIVAPEGMHRFYLSGNSGRVGASWMTKEGREDDINDNLHFLDELYQHISKNNTFLEKNLLGFSQGGATASRWHEKGVFNATNFILWASIFPPDLDLPKMSNTFLNSNNFFVVGDDDEYFNSDKIEVIRRAFLEQNLSFKDILYRGKHTITEEGLNRLLTSFDK